MDTPHTFLFLLFSPREMFCYFLEEKQFGLREEIALSQFTSGEMAGKNKTEGVAFPEKFSNHLNLRNYIMFKYVSPKVWIKRSFANTSLILIS